MLLYHIVILLSFVSFAHCSIELVDVKKRAEESSKLKAESISKGFSLQCTNNSAGEIVHTSQYMVSQSVWVKKKILLGASSKPVIILDFGPSNNNETRYKLLGTLIALEEHVKLNAITQQDSSALKTFCDTPRVVSENGRHYFTLAPGQTKISCKYNADVVIKNISLTDKTKGNISCQTWQQEFDWKQMLELLKDLHAHDEHAMQKFLAKKNPQLLVVINSLNIS
jgi:hypothetical protein